MSWRSKPSEAVPEAGDDVVAQRLAELTHREAALRKLTEAVEKQRMRLEERERDVERAETTAVARDDQRVKESARRAEQAERRVRELEERLAALEALPVAVPVEQEQVAPSAAPTEEPAPAQTLEAATTEGTYTLQRLERLVKEAQQRGDLRADEWAHYLPLLREHAEPDGRLPAQFVALVDSVFVA